MILGIDTSCYTTSLAIMDKQGRLICDMRRLLAVKQGERGLRQSDALYAHTQNLPDLLEEVFRQCPAKELTGISVSSRPRPQEGSFMPVFTAGLALARELAAALALPLMEFSHQEGHLAAALWSADLQWQQPFLALHLSGGTGEILQVTPISNCHYDIQIIGNTDLPPGQFVDRIGVALGFPFPAGAALDKLALSESSKEFRLTGSVRGTHISFSGPESAASRAIQAGIRPSLIARAVFDNIGKSLSKAIACARQQTGIQPVLLMGGVAASENLRRLLTKEDICFAQNHFSSDNAVGIAYLGIQNQNIDR